MVKRDKYHFDVESYEPIECSLIEHTEFLQYTGPENTELREGKYHGSMFWNVENFGSKKWVVCARISVDWKKHLATGMSEEELFSRCVAYLSLPPKRRKFEKRIRKPKYGKLSPVPLWFKFVENKGQSYISALVVTDKRKCRYFWGSGPTNLTTKGMKRGISQDG